MSRHSVPRHARAQAAQDVATLFGVDGYEQQTQQVSTAQVPPVRTLWTCEDATRLAADEPAWWSKARTASELTQMALASAFAEALASNREPDWEHFVDRAEQAAATIDPGQAVRWMYQASSRASYRPQCAALRILAVVAEAQPDTRASIVRFLGEMLRWATHGAVRVEAAEGLALIGTTEAHQELENKARDPDPVESVRRTVEQAIRDLT